MAGVKIVDLPALGRDLINTDLLEVSLNGGGSRKITGQEIMNASKLAIGSTPIVSGTVGRLLFQGAGNVLSQPSSLFYDAVNNRLGIGTTTPGASLDVVYESTFQSRIDMYGTLYMYNNITSLSGNIWLNNGYAIGDWGTGNNRIEFYSNRLSFFGNGNEALRIVGSTGNLLVNTTTDAGFKLDVNGTARVQTSLEVAGASGITFGGGVSVLSYSGSTLNIGNSATWADVRLFAGGVQKYSQTASLTTISNTTINLSTATVQLAGVNALTYSGTDIRIGSVSAGFNSLSMYVAGSERARIFSTGNVGINTTTDAGFRLDVNGTARVQGAITGTSTLSVVGDIYLNHPSGGGSTSFITDANACYIVQNSSRNVQIGYVSNYTFRLNNSTRTIGVSDNGASPTLDASAILTLGSTTRGFLPPRMTNAQRAAIASPAVGLIVYCTDATEGLYVYKSTGWTFIV